MHTLSDHSSESRTSDEPERRHPTLSERLFALVAVVWPLIVYGAYVWVAARELGPR